MLRDYYDAYKDLISHLHPRQPITTLPLEEAYGAILAQDLAVQYDSPQFSNSAMDGYALCDVNASSWEMVGTIAAGDHGTALELAPGQAMRIFTGAGLPQHTDAVLMQEDALLEGQDHKTLKTASVVKPKQNLRFQGEELKKGERLMLAHTFLSGAAIGLLATQGYAQVPCYTPLRVSLFSSGDELMPLGQPLTGNKIYDSNRPMLVGMLKAFPYFHLQHQGSLPDDPALIKQALLQACADSDVILCSGGASVGDKDYFKEVIEQIGVMDQWKLSIKPGKPFGWGTIQEKCKFFLLPGNPSSTFVTCCILALPAMQKLAGLALSDRPSFIRVKADFAISQNKQSRREFMRAKLLVKEDGLWVQNLMGQASHMLSSCYQADVLVEIPGLQSIAFGDVLNALPLWHQ